MAVFSNNSFTVTCIEERQWSVYDPHQSFMLPLSITVLLVGLNMQLLDKHYVWCPSFYVCTILCSEILFIQQCTVEPLFLATLNFGVLLHVGLY